MIYFLICMIFLLSATCIILVGWPLWDQLNASRKVRLIDAELAWIDAGNDAEDYPGARFNDPGNVWTDFVKKLRRAGS